MIPNLDKPHKITIQSWRIAMVMLFAIVFIVLLVWRVIDLQIKHSDILQSKADARQQRIESVNANRGAIYDRNGHLLAISSPVDSIWVNPQLILEKQSDIDILADELSISPVKLHKKIVANSKKTFLYIKRHLPPETAAELIAKGLQGVFKERQYKRYYPMGEVTSHLLGFTNIDDQGIEGLELAYDHWLQGEKR